MTKSSWVIYFPLIFPVSARCPICTVEHSRVKTYHPFRSAAVQPKSIPTRGCLVGKGVYGRRGDPPPLNLHSESPPSSSLRGQLSTNQGVLEGNERENCGQVPHTLACLLPQLTQASDPVPVESLQPSQEDLAHHLLGLS